MTKPMTQPSSKPDLADDDIPDQPLPKDARLYLTKGGFYRLEAELAGLVKVDRPKVVETVSWAAGNGDRSENGDYIYGKKRLREIDRRIRFLTKRLENANVVDPEEQTQHDRAFFGATVTYVTTDGSEVENTVTIVGVDEAEHGPGRVTLVSPVARALLRTEVGDEVYIQTPAGNTLIEVTEIRYG